MTLFRVTNGLRSVRKTTESRRREHRFEQNAATILKNNLGSALNFTNQKFYKFGQNERGVLETRERTTEIQRFWSKNEWGVLETRERTTEIPQFWSKRNGSPEEIGPVMGIHLLAHSVMLQGSNSSGGASRF